MSKRVIACMSVMLAALCCGTSQAQTYPTRPVRFIVPFAPGGGTDTFARIIAARLSETLGQQVIVDNRAGAQGNIGMMLGATAPPDGYTLMFAFVGTMAINPHLYDKPGFDTLKDFAAVGRGTEDFWVLVSHPSIKAQTVQDLVTYARANPNKLNNGSPSSAGQLLVDILNMAAKIQIVHVHYKGAGPSLIDLLAGNVQVSFPNPASVIPHVKSGKLRALMTTGSKRHAALPEVPHAIEAGYPDLDLSSWYGIAAPAATPRSIIRKLNAEMVSALAHPETLKRLGGAGQQASPSNPEEFQEQIRRDFARWGKAAKAAGAKAE